MRKEVIWAIVAGVSFGLVVAFGVVRVNSTFKQNKLAEVSPTPATISSPDKLEITIDKPENEDVVTEDVLTITGITKPQTLVIISGEDKDYITTSDVKGFFTKDIDLIAGVNQIKITALTENSDQGVEKVLVVYSSAFKVDEKSSKPKAYLGTVTDITDSTIQIKTTSSEIKQISVVDDVEVVKTSPTAKTVALADIAIGDFIVAMGYKNGNQVLHSQRILITPPLVEPLINVVSALGTDITPTKTTGIFSYESGEANTAKAKDIGDDDKVIYIETEVESKKLIRTIFILN